ncbi:MAG TPA: Cof-type HAD-IIB family hydrolase [Candidatus Acidoferrales bacterium]|nr:Cof-type HAD-IIB family hydrolase [Candidatus Acidoferrales bacterium]
MAIRLIAIDIDGTLLDSTHQVPEANQQAISAAVARGIEVALVTGRRYTFAMPVAERIPAPLTMIVNNGALIRSKLGDTYYRLLLPRDVARRVLGATLDFRLGTTVHFDRPREGQIQYEQIDWENPGRSDYWRRNREFIAQSVPLEACLIEDPIQIMYTGGVEGMRRLTGLLAGLEYARSFSFQVTQYEYRDFTLVDVLHPEVSKGAALREWCARQGYAPSEVMAIGDNFNDREMLGFAGTPVVMANSVPELRTDGWYVTGTNDQAGVAQAIQKFALQ